ncbi:hypothetical protein POJ06DRAFT_149162 [Lipomyces tetrasporus]|uniref:Uncharacterized protein n=1 Tax=Lipomyces tetrasporus TaxID=54092 RepID=A0AAD7VPX8_9ASCO|nr:uncharacterized protein POJ06DRAFT_149162 [Lipomyces tetrasporus]KAJ8098317.1 hypothetical protein POJ06DRAFT_149162 [Lipomyces tetrasporus]
MKAEEKCPSILWGSRRLRLIGSWLLHIDGDRTMTRLSCLCNQSAKCRLSRMLPNLRLRLHLTCRIALVSFGVALQLLETPQFDSLRPSKCGLYRAVYYSTPSSPRQSVPGAVARIRVLARGKNKVAARPLVLSLKRHLYVPVAVYIPSGRHSFGRVPSIRVIMPPCTKDTGSQVTQLLPQVPHTSQHLHKSTYARICKSSV